MRYVIYGTGAVGGVTGGSLHLAGVPVTLVARGEHLARMRTDGLVLDREDGRQLVDAPTATPTSCLASPARRARRSYGWPASPWRATRRTASGAAGC